MTNLLIEVEPTPSLSSAHQIKPIKHMQNLLSRKFHLHIIIIFIVHTIKERYKVQSLVIKTVKILMKTEFQCNVVD
jgi:hypothetical protein